MKTKPSFEVDIIRNVNELFDVNVVSLTFLPKGESSWVYIATTKQGDKLLLKALERLDQPTNEVLALFEAIQFKGVPRTFKSNNGRVWEEMKGVYYSVQEYIDSVGLNKFTAQPSNDQLRSLGRLLSDLHAIKIKEDQLPDVARETFDSPLAGLAQDAYKRVIEHDNPNAGVCAVQQCYEAQKENVAQLFTNLKHYGGILSSLSNKLVLTHGDVHFGNILEASSGHLYLTDWDEVSFALPEMDLKYFSNEEIAVISEGYGRDLLEHTDRIQYYRNLQMVRALWFWSDKLLHAPNDEQEYVAKTVVGIFDLSPFFLRALNRS